MANKARVSRHWREAGVFMVDSGTVWIGDPSYIFHRDKPNAELGKNWEELTTRILSNKPQFDMDDGSPGLGVCIPSGIGDGHYSVEVCEVGGVIVEARIRFISRATLKNMIKAKAEHDKDFAAIKPPRHRPERI
jgi:hypothetical protein